MYKRFIDALKLLNLLFQAIYSLALPIGIGVLIAHLTTKYLSWHPVMWAIFPIIGTFIGLYSMVKFILISIRNIERLEKAQQEEKAARAAEAERRERLVAELKIKESEDKSLE